METETNELIQELADWMVTCAAEGTKNGSWTIYADDIVEEFTSITEEWLEENQEEICNRIDDNDASLGETIYNQDDESFSMDLAFDYCENYDGSPNWRCE